VPNTSAKDFELPVRRQANVEVIRKLNKCARVENEEKEAEAMNNLLLPAENTLTKEIASCVHYGSEGVTKLMKDS
jgi:hypothetical protein